MPTAVKTAPALVGQPGSPLIIAHRGGSLEAPENSLAAIKHGVEVGSDWQEIDVTLSSDGVAVVIHDDTLDRTTDGVGAVDALPASELCRLHVGQPRWSERGREMLAGFGITPPEFGARYADQRLPTLAEVLAIPGSRLMIELKSVPDERVVALVARVVEAVQAAGAGERVVLASFSTKLLRAARASRPELPLMGLAESDDELKAMLGLPLQALGVRGDLIAEARRRADASVAVWGWTAYSVEMARAFQRQGAQGVITDVPGAVVAALRP